MSYDLKDSSALSTGVTDGSQFFGASSEEAPQPSAILATALWDYLHGKILATVSSELQAWSANLDAWSALATSAKQASDPTLTALAGVATAADKVIYATGADAFSTTDITAFGRSLIATASEATARGILNLNFDEGTWSPTIGGSSTPGTPTYSAQVGKFQRIGKRVTFEGYVVITAIAGSPAGTVRIGGLPFASANTSNYRCAVHIPYWIGFTSGVAGGVIEPNTDYIDVYRYVAGSVAVLNATEISATSRLMISGSYEVA